MASMTLVFLEDLGLKLIISGKKIEGLSLILVLVRILLLPIGVVLLFFDQRLIGSWALRIDVFNPGRWL